MDWCDDHDDLSCVMYSVEDMMNNMILLPLYNMRQHTTTTTTTKLFIII